MAGEGTNVCAKCSEPIADRFLLRLSDSDESWHSGCVRCADCGVPLTDRCFTREEKLFCPVHFFRRYGRKCGGCGAGLSPTDLVHRAGDGVFHVGCVACSTCRRPLSTGDKLVFVDVPRALDGDVSPSQNPPSKKLIVCGDGDCFQKALSSRLDQKSTKRRCAADDKSRRRRPRAGQQGTDADEPPPTTAFPTSLLGRRLLEGERAEVDAAPSTTETTRGAAKPGVRRRPPSKFFAGAGCDDDDEDAFGAAAVIAVGEGDFNLSLFPPPPPPSSTDPPPPPPRGAGGSGGGSAAMRRREPRTKIKTKQLEVLKAAFAAAPKPNRHTREQLARDTGLNMRVIQVWFQNRRSKERRMRRQSATNPSGKSKPSLYRQHKEFWRTVVSPNAAPAPAMPSSTFLPAIGPSGDTLDGYDLMPMSVLGDGVSPVDGGGGGVRPSACEFQQQHNQHLMISPRSMGLAGFNPDMTSVAPLHGEAPPDRLPDSMPSSEVFECEEDNKERWLLGCPTKRPTPHFSAAQVSHAEDSACHALSSYPLLAAVQHPSAVLEHPSTTIVAIKGLVGKAVELDPNMAPMGETSFYANSQGDPTTNVGPEILQFSGQHGATGCQNTFFSDSD